jgi:excisionase family DNA binding protein
VVADGFVTQREAAELAGCSKDTIVRARRAGHFPHARLRGQAWTLPIDDLIAAGLYDPIRGTVSTAAPTPEGVDASAVTVELARALARVAALEDVLARQDDELRFLRQLTADSFAKTGSR